MGPCFSCAYFEICSTWEVWRALKTLELLSAAPQATFYASFSSLLCFSKILGNVFFLFSSSPGQSDHLSSADKKAFLMDHVNYTSYRIQIRKLMFLSF